MDSMDLLTSIDQVNITSVREYNDGATRRLRSQEEKARQRVLGTAVFSQLAVSYSLGIVSNDVDTEDLVEIVEAELVHAFNATNGASPFEEALTFQSDALNVRLNYTVVVPDTVENILNPGLAIEVINLVTHSPTFEPSAVPFSQPSPLPTQIPSFDPTQQPTVVSFGDITVEGVEAVATATAVAVGAAVGSSVGASVGASVSSISALCPSFLALLSLTTTA